MRVISKKILRAFWKQHTDVERPLQAWLEDVKRAQWKTPADVQKIYGNDAVLSDSRAVFNIKGNRYRLVTKIHYNTGIVYIRFVGTHAEYDRIDALNV